MIQAVDSLPLTWEIHEELWILASSWSNFNYRGHLGSEATDKP